MFVVLALMVGLMSLPVAAQVSPFAGSQAQNPVCLQGVMPYVDMPNMAVTFNTSFTQPALVLLNFEARPTYAFRQDIMIRVLVDEIVVLNDVEMSFIFTFDTPANTQTHGTRSLQFLTTFLPPGTHAIRIQWRISFDQAFTPVCVQWRSLVVIHA